MDGYSEDRQSEATSAIKMDNLDDSENNAKISDSAYSNSCSNSQSRRSHSSKSTHSGSHSSGSSGYGGKPSTSGSSNNLSQPPKKDKESKKRKSAQAQVEANAAEAEPPEACGPPDPEPASAAPPEETVNVADAPSPAHALPETAAEQMDTSVPERSSVKDETINAVVPASAVVPALTYVTSRPASASSTEVFSCVISMLDGVVMYTTNSLTTSLGYPKEMWIGRSFIDFVHPRDRDTFASQITKGLAVPKVVNGTHEKATSPVSTDSTMVCRIRRYRSLNVGFGVREKVATFAPFNLKFTFKDITDEGGKTVYLVVQALPLFSAFKTPNEIVTKPIPFVIRHSANGILEYLDPDSVQYLGYLPQDVHAKDALVLYHREDLPYLRQVYENIVKEGGVARSRPYRMITQNGDSLKLETEWSSFTNPWSMKLEFISGKHYVLSGPANPDVFQTPEAENKKRKATEEDNRAQSLRESIIRIMNEALTKPAEAAKQQMTKRCQELASFMESLMEQQPKLEDELRLEIQDADHSCFERDSVMLGGISPHHDCNESKSSIETPLSYNQLNYNENLQRYFESHEPYCFDENNTAAARNVLAIKEQKPMTGQCLSPVAQHSRDSNELSSNESTGMSLLQGSSVGSVAEYPSVKLTESLLSRHNANMAKKLVKMHRENRTSTREKLSTKETRKKQKEHIARCNATFQPTMVGAHNDSKAHGVKRPSRQPESEAGAHKHHCPSPRPPPPRQELPTSAAAAIPSTITTAQAVAQTSAITSRHNTNYTTNAPSRHPSIPPAAASNWPASPVGNMNSFYVGIPQQMCSMPGMSGMFPMYYAPSGPNMPPASDATAVPATNAAQFLQPTTVPCMVYGQPMYGSPFVYSPINAQMSYPPLQHSMVAQTMQSMQTMQTLQMQQACTTTTPFGLASSNYEEACNSSLPLTPSKAVALWRERNRAELQNSPMKTIRGGASLTIALNRSTEAALDNSGSGDGKSKNTTNQSDETGGNRTDGESSYSSFYSSFFKTESGSADDSSSDPNKARANDSKNRFWTKTRQHNDEQSLGSSNYYNPRPVKKAARRKMEPPWMEQVCVTSELIYRYQIKTKPLDEVLAADKEKLASLEQPDLVNEQLGQLYMDMQLEGVAARLTLEEGITSSSSSGEETTSSTNMGWRKRDYSKLAMVYEENAPLPSPTVEKPPTSAS